MARAWVLEKVPEGKVFSGNDLWARGLPAPSNRRLLGSVLLRLEAENLLERRGSTASAAGHGGKILTWRRPKATAQIITRQREAVAA